MEVFINLHSYEIKANRIEYKQQLTEDLEKEAIAFLDYHEGGIMYICCRRNSYGGNRNIVPSFLFCRQNKTAYLCLVDRIEMP